MTDEAAQRRPAHQRNPALERLLEDLSAAVGPGGDALAARHGPPKRPILLICGTARSGSTLVTQWLARSGAWAVPTNLTSRFWRAPAVGAVVERLLFDPAVDFRGELALPQALANPDPYRSELGKTTGPGAPHELWYFWRHFLGFGDPPALDPAARAAADTGGFAAHLGAWEATAGRPLAMKALIASWDLDWLATLLPTALFLDLRRAPVPTMASLLRARERFFGDRSRWYSFRLPDMQGVEDLSPEAQVARQLRSWRGAIADGLGRVPASRVLTLSLEELCAAPAQAWTALAAFVRPHGLTLPDQHPDPPDVLRSQAPIRDPALEAAWAQSAG